MNKTGLNLLIRNIVHGDKSAQVELYTLTYTPLVRYLAHKFGSSLSAEDIDEIARQSLLLMFIHAADYRGGNGNSSAWGWAYTIARNQALKWLEIGKREMPFSDASDDDDDPDLDANITGRMIANLRSNPRQDGVEDQVIEKMLREKIMEMVQQLGKRERLILFLHYQQEWTLRKIAAHLKLTPARITQIHQCILRDIQNAIGPSFQLDSI